MRVLFSFLAPFLMRLLLSIVKFSGIFNCDLDKVVVISLPLEEVKARLTVTLTFLKFVDKILRC